MNYSDPWEEGREEGEEEERGGGKKDKGGKRLQFHSLQEGTQRYPACFSVERFHPPFHHNALNRSKYPHFSNHEPREESQ